MKDSPKSHFHQANTVTRIKKAEKNAHDNIVKSVNLF